MDRVTLLFTVIVSILVTIIQHRPERRPGNLTPIQWISALGAWALVLANASAIAIAIRDGSVILLCTATATLTIALVAFLRQNVASLSDVDTPDPVKVVVDDLEQLLGGAPRLGCVRSRRSLSADGARASGWPVMQQGRVVVRIRRDVAAWLERHQQPGGAGADVIASFARFTVLHELADVLNGDHRTFRFVRSVVIAQLVWIGGAMTAAASHVLGREASGTPLVVAASILVSFVTQSLVARRFIAERERLADWRAMQTLSPADAARLLERRGRRRDGENPTVLEKLMTDLKVQAPPRDGGGFLSRLVTLPGPRATTSTSDRRGRAATVPDVRRGRCSGPR